MRLSLTDLGSLVEIIGGGTPSRVIDSYWNGDIPWATVKDFKSTIIENTLEKITHEGLAASASNLIPEGTIILPTRMGLGKIAINRVPIAINQDLKALKIKDCRINRDYLLRFLLTKASYLEKLGKGATVKGIILDDLKKMQIPLPPLDDQIRIASLLSQAEALIAKRKESIRLLDELVRSTFLDMFGDPVRNEKGWEKVTLKTLGSLDRGVSKNRPRNTPELLGGKYPLIQTGDIANADTFIVSYKQTYSEIGYKQSKMWPAGTLCITIAANIARTGILKFDSCFPDSVVGFIHDDKIANIFYVHHLFSFFQQILEKNAPQAAQKNINLEILRTLIVPKPPLPLQNRFAATVEKVEAQKAKYRQSLAELENLYASLSQQAFSGELDVSRVKVR
jgi:type I restriction enzyme S subunit